MRAALLTGILCAASAAAQGAGDLSPPPLVEVSPEDAPRSVPPEPAPSRADAKDAPAARTPGLQPSGYPYSPYADPVRTAPRAPPGPEVGLMVSEVLFGALTAAPAVLLPYYLFLKPVLASPASLGMDANVAGLLFVMVFASVPLGVAQTELNIANTSRSYVTESWVASLSAVAGQAGVMGLYYLLHAGSPGAPAEAVLLAGSVLGVPLLTMAAINLGKAPRAGVRAAGPGALLGRGRDGGWALGVPAPLPIVGGVLLPLLGGAF